MNFKRIAILVLFITLWIPGFSSASSEPMAPEIILEPSNPGPGDIMVVTVKANGPVEGKFKDNDIYFYPSRDSFKAIVGVDLYTEPGAYPLEITVNKTVVRQSVTVAKKEYPVQKLTLPKDLVILSPENEARAEREQKRMSAIWPVDSLRTWMGNFVDPLPGKELGTPFGVRRVINDIPKSSHSGVDISADTGEAVLAPNDGVAVLVDDQFYAGKSLIIDHGQGIYTMFFHLSKINVREGQAIVKGDVIAHVGSTGRSTGPHLHWGVRMQGARVDPLQLIKLKLE